MGINDFVANFAAQFDETDASVFTSVTNYKELDEWSSLMALSIIAMTDEEYQVKLKGEDIRQSVTIQDLFDVVKSRM